MENERTLFWAGAAKPEELTVQLRGTPGVRQEGPSPTLSLPASPSYWYVLRGPSH